MLSWLQNFGHASYCRFTSDVTWNYFKKSPELQPSLSFLFFPVTHSYVSSYGYPSACMKTPVSSIIILLSSRPRPESLSKTRWRGSSNQVLRYLFPDTSRRQRKTGTGADITTATVVKRFYIRIGLQRRYGMVLPLSFSMQLESCCGVHPKLETGAGR